MNMQVIKNTVVTLDYNVTDPDGVLVDAENYTASEGSTIITFTPEYLKTLSPGKHTATVIFTDGTATAELTVISSPATGDSSNVAVYTILGLTALLGTGIEALAQRAGLTRLIAGHVKVMRDLVAEAPGHVLPTGKLAQVGRVGGDDAVVGIHHDARLGQAIKK